MNQSEANQVPVLSSAISFTADEMLTIAASFEVLKADSRNAILLARLLLKFRASIQSPQYFQLHEMKNLVTVIANCKTFTVSHGFFIPAIEDKINIALAEMEAEHKRIVANSEPERVVQPMPEEVSQPITTVVPDVEPVSEKAAE